MLKHIFFDLDHTLWDFETNSRETLKELFTEYKLEDHGLFGFDDFEKVYHRINHELWSEYNHGRITKELLRAKRFLQTFNELGLSEDKHPPSITMQYLERCSDKQAVFPFAHEILCYLGSKYEVSIITNGFPEAQYRKIRNSGMHGYFKEVFISEHIGFAKPDARIFQYALTKSQVKADECLMIGDNIETDILGAHSAGIKSIWFNPSGIESKESQLQSIRCLSELRHLL